MSLRVAGLDRNRLLAAPLVLLDPTLVLLSLVITVLLRVVSPVVVSLLVMFFLSLVLSSLPCVRTLSLALNKLSLLVEVLVILLEILLNRRFNSLFTYVLPRHLLLILRLGKRTVSLWSALRSVIFTPIVGSVSEHLFVHGSLICERIVQFFVIVELVHFIRRILLILSQI
jgi:hypothetical protein